MPHPTWMGRADWFRRHRYDERASKAQDQALLYKAYENSCFAGLPDVLLGYKYPGLSIQKTLIGRYHYLRAMNANGGARFRFLATFGHAAAASRDLLGLFTGMESRVIEDKVKSVDAGVLAKWNEIILRMSFIDSKADSE